MIDDMRDGCVAEWQSETMDPNEYPDGPCQAAAVRQVSQPARKPSLSCAPIAMTPRTDRRG
jgi:hypothetical protein